MFGKLASLLKPASTGSSEAVVFDWGEGATEPPYPNDRLTLRGPFTRVEGHAFRAAPPGAYTGPSDTSATPRASRLVLYEDDRPLGPRHSAFEIIARDGAGPYTHFLAQLYFSTSDNSDPNTNGRTYSLAVGEPSPAAVGLGGCHMNALIRLLYMRGALDLRAIGIGVAYSPLEQLRLVERQLGLQREPEALSSLAVATPPGATALLTAETRADLLLVEISANTNAVIGDVCLNRAQVMDEILAPSETVSAEVHELASRWYSQGVLKCDDEGREKAARELLSKLAGTVLDTPAIRLAIEEARGVRETPEEMVTRLGAIRDLIQPQRMVMIRSPNVYLPDGRSISWGANLLKDLREVSAELNVPLIDIGELVKEKGFAFSVTPDMTHHTDVFFEHLADVVLGTIQAFYGPWPWPEGVPRPLSPRFVR